MTVRTGGSAGPGAVTARESALAHIEAVVLAGGLGTRLRPAIGELPKVLAPVAGRPFLFHLLDQLRTRGLRRVVLSLGYRADLVIAALNREPMPQGLEVVPLVEPAQRGTAGALAYVSPVLRSDPVLVMNGDSFVHYDLSIFHARHRQSGAALSLLTVEVDQADRYGCLEIDSSDRVVHFHEKGKSGKGWINAGVYLVGSDLLARIADRAEGSLERDILEALPARTVQTMRCSGPFIDIGTPEDLARAGAVMAPLAEARG